MKASPTKMLLLALMSIGMSVAAHAQFSQGTPRAGVEPTRTFIQENLVYPADALEAGRNGTVVVAFHLDEKGQGSDYRIKTSFCEEADRQALDLVQKILWNPAYQELSAVASEMEYRIEYKAKAYKRYWKKRERTTPPLTHEADTSYHIYELYQLDEQAKPYFANGSTLAQYILKELQYPEAAKVGEIQGTVRLSFVVETDGAISNILVEQSVGGGCDNEAIRLMEGTRWIPAVKNGQYVRSRNEQDITFNFGTRNYQDGNSY
jgi:TonB family protein